MEEKKEPGIWVDNTARLACDAAAREVGAGRVNRDSRSTTFGVKPANDSSEVAMTTSSFVSIHQVGGHVEGETATGQFHQELLIVWPLPAHARPVSRVVRGNRRN